MAQQKVQVTIKGISPLLMHAFPMVPIEALEKKSPDEQAEHAAYRDKADQMLFVPGVAMQRALVSAATFSKGKGRSSLQREVCACVFVTPANLTLGTKHYEVDSRPVVVPATKGRVIRHRPRIDEWQLTFCLDYDDSLLTNTQLRKVVDDCGQRCGLLDFRPEKKGPFGRFMVTQWADPD